MFGHAAKSLLGAGVLGDGLGSLRDGMFGQFSREEETDSSLDFPGGDGGPLVVVGETANIYFKTWLEADRVMCPERPIGAMSAREE